MCFLFIFVCSIILLTNPNEKSTIYATKGELLMARKLIRDAANKRTLMRENALKRGYCMNCKRDGVFNQLHKYWYEPDIGGSDQADRFALPFCSVDCYRAYYDVGDMLRSLKLNVMGK
jgi:hypothetical protein